MENETKINLEATLNVIIKTWDGKDYPMKFCRDAEGRWSKDNKALLEDEVIDYCRDAKNWAEIKNTYFVMCDFHKD